MRAENEIEAAIQTTETITQHTIQQITTQLRDTDQTFTKGRKKSLKGQFETSQKKESKSSTQNDSATKTKNKHIIWYSLFFLNYYNESYTLCISNFF